MREKGNSVATSEEENRGGSIFLPNKGTERKRFINIMSRVECGVFSCATLFRWCLGRNLKRHRDAPWIWRREKERKDTNINKKKNDYLLKASRWNETSSDSILTERRFFFPSFLLFFFFNIYNMFELDYKINF